MIRRRRLITLVLAFAVSATSALGVAAQRSVGACCLPGGSCDITTEAECNEKGGTFLGLGTTCDECAQLSCDDENPCTVDSWNGEECVHEPLDCDDGNPCTIDTCVLGTCKHEEIDCDDGNPCTVDTCEGGECVHDPIGCDDGNPCTIDVCVLGTCKHEEVVCDDGNPCTVDSCVGGRCEYVTLDCSDGDPCTVDSCVGGQCINEAIDCADDDPCTTDVCANGRCTNEALDCDDGDPSTEDTCLDGDCVHTLSESAGASALGPAEESSTGCGSGAAEGASASDDPSLWGEGPRPVVWYLVEASWEETQMKLQAALCRAAGRAGVEFRSLMVRGEDIGPVEELLLRLSADDRPDLILSSRETMERLHPAVAGGTLFFDIDALPLQTGSAVTFVGLPGPQFDWVISDGETGEGLPGLQSLREGLWNLSELPDPISALQGMVSSARDAGANEASSGDRRTVVVDLLSADSEPCHLQIALSLGEWAGGGDAADGASESEPVTVIAPSGRDTRQEAGILPEDCALSWVMRSYGVDLQEDELWQRLLAGLPPAEPDEELLRETFGLWLLGNGHAEAAERVAAHEPLSENSIGFALRYWWLRETLKQADPRILPWWLLWAANAAKTDGMGTIQPLRLVGRIDPGTGEITIDFRGR